MAVLVHLRRRVLVAAVFVCLAGGQVLTQSRPNVEASVKAVFLFNFAKYVDWPGVAVGERSPSEVRICVTANDGFFELLKAAVQGEDIDGKPLQPIALDGLDDARRCQILYVGDAASADGRAWLAAVRGRQVLTVGDGQLSDDLVIAFVRDGNRVRFDINRDAGGRRSLNVSSKLLRLARRVKDR